MAKARPSRARRGGARGGGRALASAGQPRDRWGRYASSQAAAERAAPPAPAPRSRYGTFAKPGAKVVAPIMRRGPDGRFRGALPFDAIEYKLRDYRSELNTKRVPGERRWKSGTRDFAFPIDRTTNASRTIMAVVEGFFEESSPKGRGGSEDAPIVRHFYLGSMTALRALELTEEDVIESIDGLMGEKGFIVLRVLGIVERGAPTDAR